MTDVAPPPDRGRRHLRRLDGVRGVAILLVVAFHCFTISYARWHLPWQPGGMVVTLHPATDPPPASYLLLYPFAFGWAGVAVFFVLSGFVIHHAQLRHGLGPMGVRAFAGRRFWRIYPPYLFALLVFTAIAWAAPGARVDRIAFQAGVHAALLHNLWPNTYWGFVPTLWSLAIEVQFYALYPLLWWVRRRTNAVTPLLLTTGVSAIAMGVAALRTDWRSMTDLPSFGWWNTPQLWCTWALGMFLADRFAAGRRVFARPAAWGIALLVLTGASAMTKPTWLLSFPLAAATAAVLVERAVWSDRWTWLGGRWLVGLGMVSYSLYLWHLAIIPPIVAMASPLGMAPAMRFAVVLAATLAVGGLLSLTLYSLVERPSQSLGRRFARR
jgi:peptidoglycan/LPS O-acetylase OafA/YrhL